MFHIPHMSKSNGIAVSEPGSVSPGVLLFLWQSTCGCTNHSPACAVLRASAGHSHHSLSRRDCAVHSPEVLEYFCAQHELLGGAGSSVSGNSEELQLSSCFCHVQCPAWQKQKEQDKSKCKWGACCLLWRAFSTSPWWLSLVIKNGGVGRHIRTDAGILFPQCNSQPFWVLGSSGTSCDFCVFSEALWVSHSWSSPIFFWVLP